jgi:hypothetical protein
VRRACDGIEIRLDAELGRFTPELTCAAGGEPGVFDVLLRVPARDWTRQRPHATFLFQGLLLAAADSGGPWFKKEKPVRPKP